jgi:hypothetical protein
MQIYFTAGPEGYFSATDDNEALQKKPEPVAIYRAASIKEFQKEHSSFIFIKRPKLLGTSNVVNHS